MPHLDTTTFSHLFTLLVFALLLLALFISQWALPSSSLVLKARSWSFLSLSHTTHSLGDSPLSSFTPSSLPTPSLRSLPSLPTSLDAPLASALLQLTE